MPSTSALDPAYSLLANSDHDDAVRHSNNGREQERNDALDSRDANDLTALIFYAVGGALVATGVVLYFVLDDSDEPLIMAPFLLRSEGVK